MSAGLLQGLAARALGLDVPLRSQRVRNFDKPLADEAPAVDPEWLATNPQAATLRPLAALASPPGPGTVVRSALDEGRAAEPFDAVPPAVPPAVPLAVPIQNQSEPSQGRGGLQPRANPQQVAPSPAQPSAPALVAPPPVAARADLQPAPAASKVAAGAAMHKGDTLSVQAPAPLLPLSAPTRLLRPTAQGPVALQRRYAAVSAAALAAAQAPTEVHVSIGRVELTALAPAPTARPPMRREAAAGHSLADYLRGQSGATGRKPA